MSFTCRRTAVLASLLVATLALGVFADRAFVTNRGASSVSIFDTTTNTEAAGSPVTVGSGPIDIAADQPASVAPVNLFVANSGSNTISIVRNNPASVVATISTEPIFGTFQTPSGVALVSDATLGPTLAVVDQKPTTYQYFGPQSGRSTVRFINPVTGSAVDAFQEPSATSRYSDVAFTSDPATGNQRLWIADEGDGGVTVLKLNGTFGPPFYFSRVITYQGSGEYADFVADTAAAPTFLKAPRRLATNGRSRVVVADNGSKIVTILDGNYVSTSALGEPGAILANVDLSTWAGIPPPAAAFNCVDVAVVGNFAYVTTSNTSVAGANCYQVDLTTFAVAATQAVAGASGVAGLGATSDGAILYVGAGSGSGTITQIDISPPTDFPVLAGGLPFGPFTGGAFPFAFSSSTLTGGGGGGGGGWVSTSSVSGTRQGHCGLMGLEVALVLLALRRLRRKKA